MLEYFGMIGYSITGVLAIVLPYDGITFYGRIGYSITVG